MTEPSSALAAAWAEEAEAEPRRGLTRRRIVAAAVELADVNGLGALSMSKVAAHLGFTTMSLYRHVQNKNELILFMQDAAIGVPPARAEPSGQGWRAELEWWAREMLAGFRAHPWLLETIAMFGPPATPNQLSWLEFGLRALGGTALSEPEKLTTLLLVNAHVFSDLQFAAFGTPTAPEVIGAASYGDQLRGLLDPQRFPAVLRAVDGGAFDPGSDPAAHRDADFAFGLTRILDGVERLISTRGRA